MVVETAVIVPRNNDHTVLPRVAAHDRVYQMGHVTHPTRRVSRWMFAIDDLRNDPAHLRQFSGLCVPIKLVKPNQMRHQLGASLELPEAWHWIPQGMLARVWLPVVVLPVTCEFCNSSAIVGNV